MTRSDSSNSSYVIKILDLKMHAFQINDRVAISGARCKESDICTSTETERESGRRGGSHVDLDKRKENRALNCTKVLVN